MNKFKLMLALLGAPCMVLASCDSPAVIGSVSKVSVILDSNEMYVGDNLLARANVTTVDGASSDVTWSSSDETVAKVDENGNVTALKEGTAVITATSVFDTSKKGEATLTVKLDNGFDPEWLDAGFKYSRSFPVDVIREFLGEGSYEIVIPSELKSGAYYFIEEASSDTIACVDIVVDGAIDEYYAYDLVENGFERVYYTSYGVIEAVDPTGKYTLQVYCNYDEETGQSIAPTFFQIYKSEDAWESNKITTDATWNYNRIVNEDAEGIKEAKDWLSRVPFVALGEDYQIEQIYDDSYKQEIIEVLKLYGIDVDKLTEEELTEYLEAFGYYGPDVYLQICDYSLVEPFDGYEKKLLDAGYELIIYDEEDGYYEYYEISEGLIAYDLTFGFSETGNTIYLQKGLATLDKFPVSEANDFIKNNLGFDFTILEYTETEGAKFKTQISGGTMDIFVDHATIDEAQAYADKLEELGYWVEYSPASEYEHPSWTAVQGTLVVDFYIERFFDETKNKYLDYGPLNLFIYKDENRHDDRGIYLPETMSALVVDGSFEIAPEIVKIKNPTLVVTSSNPEVATVDGLIVTPVGDGETTITVSVKDTEYSCSMVLTCSTRKHFEIAVEKANEYLKSFGVEEELVLPEIEGGYVNRYDYYNDLYYGCYEIIVRTGMKAADYYEKLEEAGFVVGIDEAGKHARKGDVVIVLGNWDKGCLYIDIYYEPAKASS